MILSLFLLLLLFDIFTKAIWPKINYFSHPFFDLVSLSRLFDEGDQLPIFLIFFLTAHLKGEEAL